jgi:hypothetical protein
VTLGVVVLLAAGVAAFSWRRSQGAFVPLANAALPALRTIPAKADGLEPEPLTDELRAKGFSECNPHDPIGLGPYGPYERLSLGRALIPQKGGHTDDMGFDVLVHFHGGDAIRKTLVQVTRGLVLVLVDKGAGGGGYSRAMSSPAAYPELRRSIEGTLKRHCRDGRAHIRHLALSSWSAGSVAINKVLAQEHDAIDAVIVLDGLHAGYKPGVTKFPALPNLNVAFIQPALDLSRRALRGETMFVLTHSDVDPGTYPSTALTADLLLHELGLKRSRVHPGADPYGQTSAVDQQGLHVWGYRGREQMAHCSHIRHIARIVTEILEPAWDTPRMDRSVPATAIPGWQRNGAR